MFDWLNLLATLPMIPRKPDFVVVIQSRYELFRTRSAPTFLNSRETVNAPADLKDWPWIALLGSHFGGSKDVTLHRWA
jgi:hypothetical protein